VGAEESVLSVSSGPAGVRRPTAGFCRGPVGKRAMGATQPTNPVPMCHAQGGVSCLRPPAALPWIFSHVQAYSILLLAYRPGSLLCPVGQISSSARGDDAATRYGRVDDVRCPAVRDLLGSCRIERSDSSSAEATSILGISRHGFPSSSHATVRLFVRPARTVLLCQRVPLFADVAARQHTRVQQSSGTRLLHKSFIEF
jgi:hypothetical protein